jgi:hypothetical protein
MNLPFAIVYTNHLWLGKVHNWVYHMMSKEVKHVLFLMIIVITLMFSFYHLHIPSFQAPYQ